MRVQWKTEIVIVVAALVALGVTACAGGGQSMPTPKEAKAAAVELLLKTEAAVDVPWPETPEPSAEKCPGGVRFGYFVPVKTETDARSVAQTFQRLWKSEGLTVEPSQKDFGGEGGILYSATADADGAAGAAYQVNATSVVVRITSPCASGSVDDYDE
ncbi:hypothetical protein [Curtobacterium sp. MCBA15_013]|uniref:hypothetical protein n=2 Tax=unclassified Curtobacterium TaxID=257496 RepID=UPI001113F5E0|nr:hypothetical protein [Curtobacterium sp. MCBA15_013]